MIHCLPLWIALAGLNLLAIALAAIDKQRAQTPTGRRRRISHRRFRILSLLGGGLGLLLALRILRHKTRRHGLRASVAGLGLIGLAAWTLLLWRTGCIAP